MCFDFLYKFVLKFFHYKKNWKRYNHKCVFMWSTGYFVSFFWNLNSLDRFSKNNKMSSFIKTRPLRAEAIHVDGQTDTMKLIVSFRSLANVPTNDHSKVQQTVLASN